MFSCGFFVAGVCMHSVYTENPWRVHKIKQNGQTPSPISNKIHIVCFQRRLASQLWVFTGLQAKLAPNNSNVCLCFPVRSTNLFLNSSFNLIIFGNRCVFHKIKFKYLVHLLKKYWSLTLRNFTWGSFRSGLQSNNHKEITQYIFQLRLSELEHLFWAGFSQCKGARDSWWQKVPQVSE